MVVAFSDPIFHSVFAIDFLPGLSFGFVTNPSILFCRYLGLLRHLVLIFVFSL